MHRFTDNVDRVSGDDHDARSGEKRWEDVVSAHRHKPLKQAL